MKKNKKFSAKTLITAVAALLVLVLTFSACSGSGSKSSSSSIGAASASKTEADEDTVGSEEDGDEDKEEADEPDSEDEKDEDDKTEPQDDKQDSTETSETTKGMKTGDIIELGSYPQSEVTSSSVVSSLDKMSKNWKSYGYYCGTGKEANGQMAPSDFMKYADLDYNGEKYRAVTFSEYRPYGTSFEKRTSTGYTKQYENGYEINKVYYFRYEPVKWRVLDAEEGLVMCDSAIDAQAYSNYLVYSEDKYYGDSAKTYYATDWSHSSIRNWLNDDFYNTAFSSSDKTKIKDSALKTKSTYDDQYNSGDTTDKLFLLSINAMTNKEYGFNENDNAIDSARQLKPTDYSKCQGCYTDTDRNGDTNSYWWLRSPYNSYYVGQIDHLGGVYDYMSTVHRVYGIVPAMILK